MIVVAECTGIHDHMVSVLFIPSVISEYSLLWNLSCDVMWIGVLELQPLRLSKMLNIHITYCLKIGWFSKSAKAREDWIVVEDIKTRRIFAVFLVAGEKIY